MFRKIQGFAVFAVIVVSILVICSGELRKDKLDIEDSFENAVYALKAFPGNWYPEKGDFNARKFRTARIAFEAEAPESLDFLFYKLTSKNDEEKLAALELLRLLGPFVHKQMCLRDAKAYKNTVKVIDCLKSDNRRILFAACCLIGNLFVNDEIEEKILSIFENHENEDARTALALFLPIGLSWQPTAEGEEYLVMIDTFCPMHENKRLSYFAKVALFDKSPKVRLAAAHGTHKAYGKTDFDIPELLKDAIRIEFHHYNDIINTVQYHNPEIQDKLPTFEEWLQKIKERLE